MTNLFNQLAAALTPRNASLEAAAEQAARSVSAGPPHVVAAVEQITSFRRAPGVSQ